jgi:diamine N-acetyltransferase
VTGVELRPVDRDNVRAVCELQLAPGQETYVAPAAYTVAEAAYEPDGWLRAIYLDGRPVGVLYLEADRLVRLLVDARHQRRGIGRAAVGLLAAHIRRQGGPVRLYTSFVEGPGEPRAFYAELGFADTGEIDDGERLMVLTLDPAAPSA